MNKYKVSIIIPSYKPQDYLWDCLDSIRRQTFPSQDFEVFVSLNGCREPYVSAIKDYFSSYSNFNWHLLIIEQPGVSNARNQALDLISGEYIAFIDDDDFISPSYIEELYKKADHETIVVSNSFAFIDKKPTEQIPYVMTDAFDEHHMNGKISSNHIRRFFSGPCMKLISCSIIGRRRFDTSFKNGEDSLFMFLLSDRIKFVDFTSPSAIYYRRYREDSAITAKKSFKYVLSNGLRLIGEYSRVYFGNLFNYSFVRYLQVVLGTIHYMFINLRF